MNMKYRKYIGFLCLAFVGLLSGCVSNTEDPITELDLHRCMTPLNLEATISQGELVTFSWDVMKGSDHYVLELFTDASMSASVASFTLDATQVPYTADLEADEVYYYRVKAQSDSGKEDSNWAVYDKAIQTYAVKDPLNLVLTDRSAGSITVSWDADPEVTHLMLNDEQFDLNAEQIAAAQATVPNLTPSTYYTIALHFKSANRGEVAVWTRPNVDGATEIAGTDALLQALKDGASKIVLTNVDEPYVVGSVDIVKGLEIYGMEAVSGTRPVIQGEFHFTKDFTGALYAESVEFNGNGYEFGFAAQVKNGGGAAGITIDKLHYNNCTLTGYSKGIFYEWSQAIAIGSLIYENCTINDIQGVGGDGIDFRQATTINEIIIRNNTIWEAFRTFLRLDANLTVGSMLVQNNTFCKVAINEDSNAGGILNIKATFTGEKLVANNLFLYETGTKAAMIGPSASNLKADAFTFQYNYFYNLGDSYWNDNCSLAAATANGGAVLTAEPCVNAESGIFNLTNPALLAAKVGDPRWYFTYVEKEEDLTLEAISYYKAWDFTNTKIFKGDVAKSTVKDNLLFCVSATPMSIKDGAVLFSAASTVGSNGVPTDGALEFKVNTPGSVYIKPIDATETGNHVIVSVNGVVKGGAASNIFNFAPQKILISDITEESTVSIYASGPIGVSALAWALDTTQVSTALPTPQVAIEPQTVAQGTAQDVYITWDAIPNATTYSIVFNGKTYVSDVPSYTLGASTVQFLDGGSHQISVYANPGAEDIYYTQSSAGNGTLFIGSTGGDQPSGLTVYSVDQLLSAISAGKSEITLAYSGSPYDFTTAVESETLSGGTLTLTSSLTLTGEKSGANQPMIIGSLKFSGANVTDVAFKNIDFYGNGKSMGSTFEAASTDLSINNFTVTDCNISDYNKSLIYCNQEGMAINNLTFDGIMATNMGTGQDGIDLRKGTFGTVTLQNSTLANGFREVFRIDLASGATTCQNLFVKNNTIHNVSDASNKAFFYVRALVSKFEVKNNLFMNESDNALFGRGIAAEVIPYFADNVFFNMGAAWWTNITPEAATANNGLILETSPVADAASGNYTLTNGLLMSNKVGDPRWNPAADQPSSSSFTVSSVADMLNAIAAGKSDITLTAAGSPYDFIGNLPESTDAIYTITQDLTLRGEKGAKIIGAFKISGDAVKQVMFDNLTISGNERALGSFLEFADGSVNAQSITVKNCEITGFAKSIIYGSQDGVNVSLLNFDNLNIHDMGASQDGFDLRKGTYGALMVQNSTIFNGCREVFRIDLNSGNTICNTLIFKNNTVSNTTCEASGNRAFFYVRAIVKDFVVSNNLFMNMCDVPTFFRSLSTAEGAVVTPQFSNNHFFNMGAAWWNNMPSETAIANSGSLLEADPCADVANGNFTLTNDLLKAANVGDPSWL